MKITTEHINQGYKLVKEGELVRARQEFLKAKSRIEEKLSSCPINNECLQCLMLCRRNLADLYEKEGEYGLAEKELLTLYQSMLAILHKEELDEYQRNLIERSINLSYRQLMCFQSMYGRGGEE